MIKRNEYFIVKTRVFNLFILEDTLEAIIIKLYDSKQKISLQENYDKKVYQLINGVMEKENPLLEEILKHIEIENENDLGSIFDIISPKIFQEI